jgi:diguanylate cyclase
VNPLEDLSKEELVLKVKELTDLVIALKEEKNQQEVEQFPWVGNLGVWYWQLKGNLVTCNDLKIKALGYERKELPLEIGFEFFTDKIHPDDIDRVMQNMRSHLYGMTPAYECSYRIQRKDDSWVWFYDRGKITQRDENGKPQMVTGIVFDISEQKKMEELLTKQNQMLTEISRTDFLTNLNNRRTLFELLEHEIRRSQRSGEPLSVIILDIDHFKKVNDEYGHKAGDTVLMQVAACIQENIRSTDIAGRYGGRNFWSFYLPAMSPEPRKWAKRSGWRWNRRALKWG